MLNYQTFHLRPIPALKIRYLLPSLFWKTKILEYRFYQLYILFRICRCRNWQKWLHLIWNKTTKNVDLIWNQSFCNSTGNKWFNIWKGWITKLDAFLYIALVLIACSFILNQGHFFFQKKMLVVFWLSLPLVLFQRHFIVAKEMPSIFWRI